MGGASSNLRSMLSEEASRVRGERFAGVGGPRGDQAVDQGGPEGAQRQRVELRKLGRFFAPPLQLAELDAPRLCLHADFFAR